MNTQIASRSCGRRSAAPSWPHDDRSPAGAAGTAIAVTSRIAAATATPAKTGSGPISDAALPSTGPSRIPKTAAPMAPPISSPRRSFADPISQASPPAQEHAPPRPCTNRARSRATMSSASPKARLDPVRRARPVIIVRFAPILPASQPAGSDASSVPAG
jgi:hypothetical protein